MANRIGGANMTRLDGGLVRSPIGTARYAYIGTPDDSYNKNRYRITLVFDKDDPEFKDFSSKLKALRKLHTAELGVPEKDGKIPMKVVDAKMHERTGDPVGAPYMEFSANAMQVRNGESVPNTIKTFNAKGQEEDAQIYGGDTCRAEARFVGWEINGDHGIKAYLNAVQQLKCNFTTSTGSTFGSESSFVEETSTTDDLTDEAEGATFSDDTDDLLDGLV
tara:strand:+ start:659 stop:1318 length:660 start_codon:yes stop_codon:yes gene_type:complete